MDSSSNALPTEVIDLSGVPLADLTELAELDEPMRDLVQRATEAVVRETTSTLLVSVAGHNS